MSPLFRRNNSDAAPVEPEADVPSVPVGRAVTEKKGKPTPKRKDAQKRNRSAEPPPKDSKEARQRMRERMRNERAERYEGMRRGDDRYLTGRDRGPVRRLVRDLIDARRNVGPFFFSSVIVVFVFSLQFWPPIVQLGATVLWAGALVLLVADVFLIFRLVRRAVGERFPDSEEKTIWLVLYAVLRSVSFRRLRNPSPLVKPGDSV